MKLFIIAALAAMSPFALAQAPVTAVAGNQLTQSNQAVTKPAPKPPSKPPTKKPSPSPAPAKPVVQSSNQNQNANSNANANGNSNTNTAQGGKGGSAISGASAAGGSAQGGDAAGGSASSGSNSVDASEHSQSNTNVHELFIPPVVPPTPPSTLAVGNVVVETSACGPLQRVVKTPVDGTFYGLFHNAKTPLGFTEELAPYVDENGQIQEYRKVPTEDGYYLFGHQVTQYTAIVGVAGARSSAVGGGAGSGSWGQAGLGTSSSNQRMITTIQLRQCEIGRIQVQTQTVQAETPPTSFTAPVITADGGLFTTPVGPIDPFLHPKPLQSHKHRVRHPKDKTCLTVNVR